MEDLFIAESINVEFERFELHAPFVRDVADLNGSKVWKAAARAYTSELRALKINLIGSVAGAVLKALQLVIFDHFFAV